MSEKIKIKRSAVLDGSVAKAPTADQLDFGELALNYHHSDPVLFIKNSNGDIIRLTDINSYVTSVNSLTGDVVLSASDIGATEAGDNVSIFTNDAGYITSASAPVQSVNTQTGDIVLGPLDIGAATAAQGTKADSALQPGDNISELTNDSNFITSADIPASSVLSVNGQAGEVVLTASDVGAAASAQGGTADTALQPGDNISALTNNSNYIASGDNISTLTNNANYLASGDGVSLLSNDANYVPVGSSVSVFTNDAGYITSADIPSAAVDSVNGKTGTVVINADDVGALESGDNVSSLTNDAGYITSSDIPAAPVTSVNTKTGNVTLSASDVGAATSAQGTKADTALQSGDAVSALSNDAGYITSGSVNNGSLVIKTAGENATATGTFTANQSGTGTLTLPTIRYTDISGKPSIPSAAGNGTITIVQPGTSNQTFTVNQSGNKTITLKNDNTVPTVNNGALTIKLYGQSGSNQSGSFTANGGNSTITLPQIAYNQLSGRPSIPSVGNGTITIVQPGTSNQTFTVNQSGNKTITLKNDNTTSVNLGYTGGGSTGAGTITNSAGNNASIPIATTSVAGLLSGSDKSRIDSAVLTTGAQTLSSKTLSSPAITGTIREDVYAANWSGTPTLNPGNGSIQFITLTGNSTPSQSGWDNGESVTLHIDDGSARTLNWGTLNVQWTGGSAPELPTSGDAVVQLWKSNNVIYGASVGDVA